jgi:hypothetical protein
MRPHQLGAVAACVLLLLLLLLLQQVQSCVCCAIIPLSHVSTTRPLAANSCTHDSSTTCLCPAPRCPLPCSACVIRPQGPATHPPTHPFCPP